MKTLSILAVISLLFWACQSDQTQQTDTQIASLEKQLAEETQPSSDKLQELLKLYEEHVNQHPKEKDKNAELLLKAAEIAISLGQTDKALSLYDRVLKEYSTTPKAAQALFLKGYAYDQHLKNLDSARVIYQAFIAKYPQDDFADDAQFLLNNLGKSDEEIIEQFEKNRADSSSTQ